MGWRWKVTRWWHDSICRRYSAIRRRHSAVRRHGGRHAHRWRHPLMVIRLHIFHEIITGIAIESAGTLAWLWPMILLISLILPALILPVLLLILLICSPFPHNLFATLPIYCVCITTGRREIFRI